MTYVENNMTYLKRNKIGILKKITASLILVTLIVLIMITVKPNIYWKLEGKTLFEEVSLQKMMKEYENRQKNNYQSLKECLIPQLKHQILANETLDSQDHCKRLKPIWGSCDIAMELFMSDQPSTCDHKTHIFCQVKEVSITEYMVHCDSSRCHGNLELGLINMQSGALETTSYASSTNLEDKIYQLLVSPKESHFGFCYVKCPSLSPEVYNHYELYDDNDDYDNTSYRYTELYDNNVGIQLLILPPKNLHLKSSPRRQSAKSTININIIMLDSVSRHHFFRSLPKTVDLFERLNSENPRKGKVLDFQLLQALKSWTFETLVALFTGFVNNSETPFGMYDMPPAALDLGILLEPFRKLGYHTLWLEDLCWSWEWGIGKDFLVYNNSLSNSEMWQKLLSALSTASIERIDASLTSCPILKANAVNDPFQGPDALCFNGQYQHDYLIDYVSTYQRHVQALGSSYFSFFQINTSHEPTGQRIQTLDNSLAHYLEGASKQKNTLTIIFSDHGNSYGKYMSKTSEGRVELYHPSLFMILPDEVENSLGPKAVMSLIKNQLRLVSILDLHNMLYSLSQGTKENIIPKMDKHYNLPDKGLLSDIDVHRSCDHIPRLMPTLCICQGFEENVPNNTRNALYAHFVLGRLNNIIQDQYREANKDMSSPGKCRRLRASSFVNVKRTQRNDDTSIIKMDLNIVGSKPTEAEIFFVAMKITEYKFNELLTFDRMTSYGQYKQCADRGVDPKLCICDTKENERTEELSGEMTNFELLTNTNWGELNDDGIKNCFSFAIEQNQDGVSINAVNDCENKMVEIIFTLNVENMDVSEKQPIQSSVFPDSEIIGLFPLTRTVLGSNQSWDIGVICSVMNHSCPKLVGGSCFPGQRSFPPVIIWTCLAFNLIVVNIQDVSHRSYIFVM